MNYLVIKYDPDKAGDLFEYLENEFLAKKIETNMIDFAKQPDSEDLANHFGGTWK